jgi:hypothetical protein
MLLYIDAGTGSLIVQALAAGFLSALFYAKKIIRFFKYMFIKKRDEEGINV